MDEETAVDDMRALEELPDLRNRLAALESELGLGDSGDDDWSDHALPTGSFCDRFWHCLCKSVTVPCVFLVSVLVAVCVIVFCIFPASIIMVVAVAFYYCCARDPIPFRVLLTAMLGADSGDGNDGARPIRTPADIHPALIKRRCLGKTTASQSEIEKDQFLMETESGMLLFSNPLSEEDLEGRDDTAPWLSGGADKSQDNDLESTDDRAPWHDEETLRDMEKKAMRDMEKDLAGDSDVNNERDVEEDADAVDDGIESDCVDAETAERKKEDEQDTKNDTDVVGDGTENDRADLESAQQQKEEHAKQKTIPKMENETGDTHFGEGDVEMNTLNRKEEAEAGHHDESDSHSCDICLLAFEEGQVVAWSNNSQCEHAYHLDCITDWLIKQKTCPNCRADYLRMK